MDGSDISRGEAAHAGGPVRPSSAELRILQLMLEGLPDAAIARRLGVSAVTIRRRMRALCERLGVRTRLQAVAVAVRRGWL